MSIVADPYAGAVAGVKTLEVAHLNANAIMKALQRAATPGQLLLSGNSHCHRCS